MTPQEFVTRVYNMQEGVIIDDLYPTDEKYKEVLYQANLVIDDFMRQHDWSFLRQSIVLGDTCKDREHPHFIPKFYLPKHVDRVSTLYGDGIKLYKGKIHRHKCCEPEYEIYEDDYVINVPFVSKGYDPKKTWMEHSAPLCARNYGHYIELTRMPLSGEDNRIAVCDCQVRIPHLHICNDKCKDKKGNTPSYEEDDYRPCAKIEHSIFNPFYESYMIYKTAYATSKYSPIAGGIRSEIMDAAQKELSKLRNLDSEATEVDVIGCTYNHLIRQVY